MAVIEYDEYKQKLQALEPTLRELEKALGIPKDRQELKNLQAETEQEGFWNNIEHSQKVSQQIKRLEHRIKKYDRLVSEWEDTVTLCEMAQEEDDASLLPEVTGGYENLEKEISERRLAALLSGEYDANNAILTFHAGAGGTDKFLFPQGHAKAPRFGHRQNSHSQYEVPSLLPQKHHRHLQQPHQLLQYEKQNTVSIHTSAFYFPPDLHTFFLQPEKARQFPVHFPFRSASPAAAHRHEYRDEF